MAKQKNWEYVRIIATLLLSVALALSILLGGGGCGNNDAFRDKAREAGERTLHCAAQVVEVAKAYATHDSEKILLASFNLAACLAVDPSPSVPPTEPTVTPTVETPVG